MSRTTEKQQEAPKVAAPAKADGWPKYLKSTTPFGYTDPDSNIHFGPVSPIKIDAAPAEGSWLHGQMAANLISEA
jgi:hypothetical protein